ILQLNYIYYTYVLKYKIQGGKKALLAACNAAATSTEESGIIIKIPLSPLCKRGRKKRMILVFEGIL
ncbi:MAG: hypothetical protein KAI33_09075, partial [Elusimicrobiales bacterium]|nr:hypothetical protein [Elusimicrobiales bacterium]